MIVEMIKNITKSMTVDNKEAYRTNDVTDIIDQLNRIATTDKLTGLMNRRYIDAKLPQILESAKKTGRPVSIAMLDIDFFKKVNDEHGHQAGDYILSELADRRLYEAKSTGRNRVI